MENLTLSSVFSGFSAFGFSGSRRCVPSAFMSAAFLVPSSASVFVGCALGLDWAARRAFPSAVVFRASSFAGSVSGGSWLSRARAALALRSAACVRACVAAGGLWVSFPSGACPSSVRPSLSPFRGGGSGSWASAALVLGLGSPVLFWLPSGVCVPSAWSCSVVPVGPVGGGWFLVSPVVQPSLFP